MKKSLLPLLALLLLTLSLQAADPADLAREEQRLSHKLLSAYLNGANAESVLRDLRQTQHELKSSLKDPEIRNLLAFIDLCIGELQGSLRRPVTPANIEIVSDLTTSIDEGSRFILGAVARPHRIARR